MKWPWRKPKKLNETTRLYALYGENANLEYLDSVDKQTIQRVEVVENNLQQTNQNLNQTNQNLQNLTNRVDNLPGIDVNKEYVDRQDATLSSRINANVSNIAQNTTNINNLNTKLTNNVNSINTNINSVESRLNNSISNVDGKVNTLNTVAAKLSGVSDQRWSSTNIFEANTGFTSRINMNNNKIINLANPIQDTDAANKKYVDDRANLITQQVSSYSIYENRVYTGAGEPTYWTSGVVRTFKYPPTLGILSTIPNNIKYGNYILTAHWIVKFNGGWTHSGVSTLYKRDLAGGHNVLFDPSEMGFFTAPTDIGLPTQLVLHSVVGIRVH